MKNGMNTEKTLRKSWQQNQLHWFPVSLEDFENKWCKITLHTDFTTAAGSFITGRPLGEIRVNADPDSHHSPPLLLLAMPAYSHWRKFIKRITSGVSGERRRSQYPMLPWPVNRFVDRSCLEFKCNSNKRRATVQNFTLAACALIICTDVRANMTLKCKK